MEPDAAAQACAFLQYEETKIWVIDRAAGSHASRTRNLQFRVRVFLPFSLPVAKEEGRKATALTGTDMSPGWPFVVFVPH